MSSKKPDGIIAPPRLPKRAVSAALSGLEDRESYTGLSLSGCALGEQHAEYVTFEKSSLRQVVLSRSRLPRLQLADVRLDACDLSAADWEKADARRVELIGCRMIGFRMGQAEASDILIKGCNAAYAQFEASVFKGARFESCVLTESSFQGADLRGALFAKCDLSGAKMSDAKLEGADLRGSKIDGVWLGLKELQGAIVDLDQMISIARLLGIVVQLD